MDSLLGAESAILLSPLWQHNFFKGCSFISFVIRNFHLKMNVQTVIGITCFPLSLALYPIIRPFWPSVSCRITIRIFLCLKIFHTYILFEHQHHHHHLHSLPFSSSWESPINSFPKDCCSNLRQTFIPYFDFLCIILFVGQALHLLQFLPSFLSPYFADQMLVKRVAVMLLLKVISHWIDQSSKGEEVDELEKWVWMGRRWWKYQQETCFCCQEVQVAHSGADHWIWSTFLPCSIHSCSGLLIDGKERMDKRTHNKDRRKEGRSHSIFNHDERERKKREEEANGHHVEMELLIRFRCKGCLKLCV